MFRMKLSFLVVCSVFVLAISADQRDTYPIHSDQDDSEYIECSDEPEGEHADDQQRLASELPHVAIADQILDSMSIAVYTNLLTKLIATPIEAVHEQEKILEKLVPLMIGHIQEHALQALHDCAYEIKCVEYRSDHPIKSCVTNPIGMVTGSSQKQYQELQAICRRYFSVVGTVAQLQERGSKNVYVWLNQLLDAFVAVQSSPAHVAVHATEYKQALHRLRGACAIIQANEFVLCRRGTQAIGNKFASVVGWIMQTGVGLGACAGGAFLISKYLSEMNTPDIAAVKQNYKNTVRAFHRQYVIPPVNGVPVTNAMIDAAADKLDTSFLEDQVIPAITTRVRTVPTWMPNIIARAADIRHQLMPQKVDAFLRQIPARTLAVATTIIWLTDKTICDVLPFGIETVVGMVAWLSIAAFADRIVAIADAVITATGGLTAAPDMGMLLAIVYKKRLKLAVLKYGGGLAGFLGLCTLYRAAQKYSKQTLREYITHNVHGIVATLAPYAGDVTGHAMKPEDLGKVLHYTDEVQRELNYLSHDKRRLFERDIESLQQLDTPVYNRIQLINSMYQTYNLATVPV